MNKRALLEALPGGFAMATLTAIVTLTLAIGLSALLGGESRLAREQNRCYNAAILQAIEALAGREHNPANEIIVNDETCIQHLRAP